MGVLRKPLLGGKHAYAPFTAAHAARPASAHKADADELAG